MTMKQEILDHFGKNYLIFYRKYFDRIKKGNVDEYTALCKFHTDRKPSFSFNNTTGYSCCHACGFKGDIFTVYSCLFELNGNFMEIMKGIAKDFGIYTRESKFSSEKIVKTYDYLDADGNLVHQTVRYKPKNFMQRRPNGKGGWIWKLDGIDPVIYNLPEVVKAEVVYLCEGEKDCETLKKYDLTSTTCPMGAGKWRKEYNDYFRDKSIILLPDNDPQGIQHMENVANSLLQITKSIKIVTLPGLPKKGDVTDWLRAGNTNKDLNRCVDESQEYEPTDPEKRLYTIYNAILDSSTFLDAEFPPKEIILNPWLKKQSIP